MKEYEKPEDSVDKHLEVDPYTGKIHEVETIAGVEFNEGEFDEIVDEIKRVMFECIYKNPELLEKPLVNLFYEAIREMYRRKSPRFIQLMKLMKETDKVNPDNPTPEQISKIGKSEQTTPITIATVLMSKIRENMQEIVQQFSYRLSLEELKRRKMTFDDA